MKAGAISPGIFRRIATAASFLLGCSVVPGIPPAYASQHVKRPVTLVHRPLPRSLQQGTGPQKKFGPRTESILSSPTTKAGPPKAGRFLTKRVHTDRSKSSGGRGWNVVVRRDGKAKTSARDAVAAATERVKKIYAGLKRLKQRINLLAEKVRALQTRARKKSSSAAPPLAKLQAELQRWKKEAEKKAALAKEYKEYIDKLVAAIQGAYNMKKDIEFVRNKSILKGKDRFERRSKK